MKKLGVIIDPFQFETLTEGKLEFLTRLAARCDETLIIIETTRSKFTKKDPLDYDSRLLMVKGLFPDAYILPCTEQKSNDVWSVEIDKLITNTIPFVGTKVEVKLLDSTDGSTIKYTGKYNKDILPFNETEDRSLIAQSFKAIASNPIDSVDFRKGIIYSCMNRYPKVHPTVDVAVFNEDYSQVLVGRKHMESLFRFIGGFTDPTDLSYEMAVRRETREEAGNIEIDDIRYIQSQRIDDWRYPTDDERIMTTLFGAKYVFGKPVGGDDIAEVKWVDVDTLIASTLVGEHAKLVEAVKDYKEKQILSAKVREGLTIGIEKIK